MSFKIFNSSKDWYFPIARRQVSCICLGGELLKNLFEQTISEDVSELNFTFIYLPNPVKRGSYVKKNSMCNTALGPWESGFVNNIYKMINSGIPTSRGVSQSIAW